MPDNLLDLTTAVRNCHRCAEQLPLGPRPVIQVSATARILIAGQAPGTRVHETGIPFDDPSGKRLRQWLGISRDTFYDPQKIAILPMGFCYPGRGKSGDLPPIPICADIWRQRILDQLNNIKLTVVIGQYAQKWHLEDPARNLTETVRSWQAYAPTKFPLPHPSPRNNIWLKKNPWFESDVLPKLQQATTNALAPRPEI